MLVIGDSYLLSALPVLMKLSRSNILLVCDNDPQLLAYIVYCRQALLDSQNETEYLKIVASLENSAIKDEKYIEDFLKAYQAERKKLEKNHCFYSQQNMRACQEAHRNVVFIPVCINMFDPDQVAKLATLIEGKISLLNLTNLREWDPIDCLDTALKLLPSVSHPIILSASHRDKFGTGPENPKTRAVVCSIEEYNKTFIENILFSIFIRRGNADWDICEQILQGVNHINTPDSHGYTPIEVAVLQFFSVYMVKLLLKYGANIPDNLKENLSEQIRNYHRSVLSQTLALKNLKEDIAEIEKIINLFVANDTVITYPDAQNRIFIEIGENALVFTAGDTHVKKLSKGATIVVTHGDLIVEEALDHTHLQTDDGHIAVENFQGKHMRILSARDVELDANVAGMVDIIAKGGTIKVKDLGPHSFLLAKNGICGGNIGRDSILLAAAGNIHIGNAEYGVCLATADAHILIDKDLPHGGKVSIKGKGKVRHHLKGLVASGSSTRLNTNGPVIDRSTDTHCYFHTGQFFKKYGHYNPATHTSFILNFGYKWLTCLAKWPIYMSASKEAVLSYEALYISILEILDLTPTSLLEMRMQTRKGVSVSSSSIQCLGQEYYLSRDCFRTDRYLEEIVLGLAQGQF